MRPSSVPTKTVLGQHNSSRTGKLDPDILTDDNHDDETIGPSALERPAEDSINRATGYARSRLIWELPVGPPPL